MRLSFRRFRLGWGVHRRFAWRPMKVEGVWIWLEQYWLVMVRSRVNGEAYGFKALLDPGDTPPQAMDRAIPAAFASLYEREPLC